MDKNARSQKPLLWAMKEVRVNTVYANYYAIWTFFDDFFKLNTLWGSKVFGYLPPVYLHSRDCHCFYKFCLFGYTSLELCKNIDFSFLVASVRPQIQFKNEIQTLKTLQKIILPGFILISEQFLQGWRETRFPGAKDFGRWGLWSQWSFR